MKLQRHNILLYEGDYERLQTLLRERSAAEIIRILVRRYIDDVERKLEQAHELEHRER